MSQLAFSEAMTDTLKSCEWRRVAYNICLAALMFLSLVPSAFADCLFRPADASGATCAAIPESETCTYLFNPKGAQVFYLRSFCYKSLALKEDDLIACSNVVEAHSLFLDGSDFTQAKCEAEVKAKKAKDDADAAARAAAAKKMKDLLDWERKQDQDKQQQSVAAWDEFQKKMRDPRERARRMKQLPSKGWYWNGRLEPKGYYHCAVQKPMMKLENDPRLFPLIEGKRCRYFGSELPPPSLDDPDGPLVPESLVTQLEDDDAAVREHAATRVRGKSEEGQVVQMLMANLEAVPARSATIRAFGLLGPSVGPVPNRLYNLAKYPPDKATKAEACDALLRIDPERRFEETFCP